AAFETVRLLVLTGGEATIREDLPRLIEYARHKGIYDIVLQSNGRELKRLTYLKELARCGLRSVLLSLHGPDSSTHDSITRSVGSFQEAIEALSNLHAIGIPVTVNAVMCRDNYNTLEALVQLVSTMVQGAGTIRFSYPIIEGGAFDNRDSI